MSTEFVLEDTVGNKTSSPFLQRVYPVLKATGVEPGG